MESWIKRLAYDVATVLAMLVAPVVIVARALREFWFWITQSRG